MFRKLVSLSLTDTKIIEVGRGEISLDGVALEWLHKGISDICKLVDGKYFWRKLREANRAIILEAEHNNRGGLISMSTILYSKFRVCLRIPCSFDCFGWKNFYDLLRRTYVLSGSHAAPRNNIPSPPPLDLMGTSGGMII